MSIVCCHCCSCRFLWHIGVIVDSANTSSTTRCLYSISIIRTVGHPSCLPGRLPGCLSCDTLLYACCKGSVASNANLPPPPHHPCKLSQFTCALTTHSNEYSLRLHFTPHFTHAFHCAPSLIIGNCAMPLKGVGVGREQGRGQRG